MMRRGIVAGLVGLTVACMAFAGPAAAQDDPNVGAALERAHRLVKYGKAGSEEFPPTVRAAAGACQLLEASHEAGKALWTACELNAEGKSFDGVRFRTPPGGLRNLFWAFALPGNSKMDRWGIMPVAETAQRPGFHGYWYWDDEKLADVDLPARSRLFLQRTLGAEDATKLQPDAEYILWFDFAGTEPEQFHIALSALPMGDEKYDAASTAQALGLRPAGVHLACYLGVVDRVTEILEQNPKAVALPDIADRPPVSHAVMGDQPQVIELLMEHGVDINAALTQDVTALHLAVKEDVVAALRFLLAHGAKAETCDKKGWTALHIAARDGKAQAVTLMLDAGVDVNLRSENGWTPLHSAALAGREDIIALLLAKGAGSETQSAGEAEAGWTALHFACKGGSQTIVEGLLGAGADIQARDTAGWTPLHRAAHLGRFDIVKLLVAGGADVNAGAQDGPWELALGKGVLVTLLGADDDQPTPFLFGEEPPLGKWIHLAMVYAEGQVSVFADGAKGGQYDAPAALAATDADLMVGRSPASPAGLECSLREVRLSDVARYGDAFTPEWRFEPDENTVLLLHCDEGKGDVAHDSSGRGNDARLAKCAWAVQ